MTNKKKPSATPVDWNAIADIRRRSYHGQRISPDELKLCELAIQEDVERYHRIGVQLREDYQRFLNGEV